MEFYDKITGLEFYQAFRHDLIVYECDLFGE